MNWIKALKFWWRYKQCVHRFINEWYMVTDCEEGSDYQSWTPKFFHKRLMRGNHLDNGGKKEAIEYAKKYRGKPIRIVWMPIFTENDVLKRHAAQGD